MDRDSVYIKNILDAIGLIEQFVSGKDWELFQADIMAQNAVVRQLEIIGEAAKRLSQEFKTTTSSIPWKDIAGMRDKIAHDYMSVDLLEVWGVVEKDLPDLKSALTIVV